MKTGKHQSEAPKAAPRGERTSSPGERANARGAQARPRGKQTRPDGSQSKKRGTQALLFALGAAVIVLLLLFLPRSGEQKAPAQTEDAGERGLPFLLEPADQDIPILDSSEVELAFEDGVLTVSGSGAVPALSRDLEESEIAAVQTLVIGEDINAIDAGAFRGCTRLKAVELPDGLRYIGPDAFAESRIESITIPASVTQIAEGAFRGCTALKEIRVENGSSSFVVADGALYNADRTVLLCYPGARSARGFRVPEGVLRIADHAFCGFQLKETLLLPASLTELGPDALSRCFGVSAIKVDGGNAFFCAEDGVLYDRDKRVLLRYPSAKTTKRFTLPRSVEEIGPSAFRENYELSEVSLPAGLLRIDREAFSGCSFLSSLTLPQSLLSIGDEAFLSCSRLANLRLPEKLGLLGARAFAGCYGLETLTLPGGLRDVGEEAFLRCYGLRTAVLSEGVETIGAGAFRSCSALESLTLPATLMAIDAGAFDDCPALKTVRFAGSQADWDALALEPGAIPEGAELVCAG